MGDSSRTSDAAIGTVAVWLCSFWLCGLQFEATMGLWLDVLSPSSSLVSRCGLP